MRVMRMIRQKDPTHAIHLGDVYFSGEKKEIERRFLRIIDTDGPSPQTCRYLALNSNHEMYSGGQRTLHYIGSSSDWTPATRIMAFRTRSWSGFRHKWCGQA